MKRNRFKTTLYGWQKKNFNRFNPASHLNFRKQIFLLLAFCLSFATVSKQKNLDFHSLVEYLKKLCENNLYDTEKIHKLATELKLKINSNLYNHQQLNKLGVSQDRFSKLTDVTYNTIIKIESGANKNPTIEPLTKIAKALCVGVDNLIK